MEEEKEITYKLYEDGYDIYIDGVLSLIQRDPYGKIFDTDGSYEENAELHIEFIKNHPVSPESEPPTEEEILRGDIDYIAVMEDLTLPSQFEKEEVE